MKNKMHILRHITPLLIFYPIGFFLFVRCIYYADTMGWTDDTFYIAYYLLASTFALLSEQGYILTHRVDVKKIIKIEIVIIALIISVAIVVINKLKNKEPVPPIGTDVIVYCPGYCGDNIVREKISTIENGYIRDYYFVDSYYYGKSDSMLVYDYAMSEIYGYLNACRGDEYVASSKNVLMRDSLANIPLHRLRNRNNAIEMPIETVKPRISIVETGDQKAYSENNNTYFFGALYDEETKRYVVYSWIMYHIYGSDKGRNAYSYYLRNYGESYSLRLEGFDLWSK